MTWREPTTLEQAVIELRAEGLLPSSGDDADQLDELEDAYRQAFGRSHIPIRRNEAPMMFDQGLMNLLRAWRERERSGGGWGSLAVAAVAGVIALQALRRLGKT